jgi:hypothetical protein
VTMNPFTNSQSEKDLNLQVRFVDTLSKMYNPPQEVSALDAEKALMLVEEQFEVSFKQTSSVASALDFIKRHIHKHVAPEKQNDLLMLVDASITRVKEACNSQVKMKQTLKHVSTYVNGEVSEAAAGQERKRRRVEPADKTNASEMDSTYEFDPDAEWNPDTDFMQRPARSGSA